MPAIRTLIAGSGMALLAACASVGPGNPLPAATPETGASSAAWPIQTREDIDLWLHGYAMLSDDTTQVPFFKRGYRERMTAFKRRANVSTQLDANYQTLHDQLAQRPGYVSGQFLPLYFGSWDDMRQAIQLFLGANGNPRAVTDPQQQAIVATFASVFPQPADREWLRTFTAAIEDENTQYYQNYWNARQRDLAPVLARTDSLWEHTYLAKFQRLLDNQQMSRGIVYASLPLDGEGRTIAGGVAQRGNSRVTVPFPESPTEALDPIYVFAHEVVGSLTALAVTENTTPAEKRQGLSDRYTSPAAVRGGELLLKRIAPDLAAGYARYYLASANVSFTTGDPEQALARAFPLPQPILDAIDHQLGVVLGGI